MQILERLMDFLKKLIKRKPVPKKRITKNIKKVIGLSLMAIFPTLSFAGDFTSVYQLNNYNSVGINKYGFNTSYEPNGYSGCVIGMAQYSALCGNGFNGNSGAMGGLSFRFDEYNYPGNQEIKVYIPEGALATSIVASLPQGTVAAAAIRLDSPPIRTSVGEYEYAAARQDSKNILSRILSGEEVITTHDGGGTFSVLSESNGAISYVSSNRGETLSSGHWVYIRLFTNEKLYQFSGTTMVDMKKYIAGYDKMAFDNKGDPVYYNYSNNGGNNQGNTGPSTPPLIEDNSITSLSISTNTLSVSDTKTFVKVSTNPKDNARNCLLVNSSLNEIYYTSNIYQNEYNDYGFSLSYTAQQYFDTNGNADFYVFCNRNHYAKITLAGKSSFYVTDDNADKRKVTKLSFPFIETNYYYYNVYILAYSKQFPSYFAFKDSNNNWAVYQSDNIKPYKTYVSNGDTIDVDLRGNASVLSDFGFELYAFYIPSDASIFSAMKFIGNQNGYLSANGINSLYKFK